MTWTLAVLAAAGALAKATPAVGLPVIATGGGVVTRAPTAIADTAGACTLTVPSAPGVLWLIRVGPAEVARILDPGPGASLDLATYAQPPAGDPVPPSGTSALASRIAAAEAAQVAAAERADRIERDLAANSEHDSALAERVTHVEAAADPATVVGGTL